MRQKVKPVSWRRWLTMALIFGAVVLPALAIAYYGTISYQAARDLVDATSTDEHRSLARQLARDVEADLRRDLELAAARGKDIATGRAFRVSSAGELVEPSATPFLPTEPRSDAEVLSLIDHASSMNHQRVRRLEALRVSERAACPEADCELDIAHMALLRRSLQPLTEYEDVGAEALCGLVRIDRLLGNIDGAIANLHELRGRFADHIGPEGIAYDLIADLGLAEIADHETAWIDLYAGLVQRRYHGPNAALEVVAARARDRLARGATSAARAARLEPLDQKFREALDDVAFARWLQFEIDDVIASAEAQPRGRPALRESDNTILYRRLDDGSIVGIVLDGDELAAISNSLSARITKAARGVTAVLSRGDDTGEDSAGARTLATASLGRFLPHLSVRLLQDPSVADPLDEVVDTWERHLAISAALGVILILGVVATVRSAQRQRELARLKSDFVTTVSHELKTPLTSIRMFAEMLQQRVAGDDREREARYHDIIIKESERLGLLIANLLDYSQIERGTREYRRRPCLAEDMAREAIETFARLREGERSHVQLTTAVEAASAHVYVDRNVIVQALLNLLSNASKYGGDGPIEVEVAAPEVDWVVLSVRDRGPGIPKAEHGRVFREFYRASAARRSGVEGTGLGLALVKRHVEAQGGQVELVSTPGEGATFSLVFERHEGSS